VTNTKGTGAQAQVARLLTLVPFLHHHEQVRLADAAALLDTSPQQVLGDLKVLFMCGLPGGLPDDLIDVDLEAIQTDDQSPVLDGVIRVSWSFIAERFSQPSTTTSLPLTPTAQVPSRRL
jgi:proteasome accessory factor C